jgi:hypothetical protein
MPDDQSSTATQRVRAFTGPAAIGGRRPLWSDGPGASEATNALLAGVPPVAGSVTRELWERTERKRFDVMVSGQRMDAEYDRYTKSPEELLAEIRANRLEWVRRGMDSRSDVPAELRDALGSQLVAADLARFEHLVPQVAKSTWYSGYIVRYGPRPVARVFADVFGILTELALRRDEQGQARRWSEARNDVLRTEHNWRPRTLLVRERGVQTRNSGLVFALRTQTHDRVEVQRTVAQFPPDPGIGGRTGASPAGAARGVEVDGRSAGGAGSPRGRARRVRPVAGRSGDLRPPTRVVTARTMVGLLGDLDMAAPGSERVWLLEGLRAALGEVVRDPRVSPGQRLSVVREALGVLRSGAVESEADLGMGGSRGGDRTPGKQEATGSRRVEEVLGEVLYEVERLEQRLVSLGYTWGVITGTAHPPDDDQWRTIPQPALTMVMASPTGA